MSIYKALRETDRQTDAERDRDRQTDTERRREREDYSQNVLTAPEG